MNLKLFTANVIILCTLVLVVDCSKDDNPVAPSQTGLVGTWQLNKMTFTPKDSTINAVVLTSDWLAQADYFWTIKIKSDSTYESSLNFGDGTHTEQGAWSTSGNKLKASFGTEQSSFEYSLDNNTLILEWDDIEDGVAGVWNGEFKRQ